MGFPYMLLIPPPPPPPAPGTTLASLLIIRLFLIVVDDYTDIYSSDGKSGLALKSMQEWENRLPEKHFVRIHRSTIININYIIRIEKWFNNSFKVYLKDVKLPEVMSRRYAARIKDSYA